MCEKNPKTGKLMPIIVFFNDVVSKDLNSPNIQSKQCKGGTQENR